MKETLWKCRRHWLNNNYRTENENNTRERELHFSESGDVSGLDRFSTAGERNGKLKVNWNFLSIKCKCRQLDWQNIWGFGALKRAVKDRDRHESVCLCNKRQVYAFMQLIHKLKAETEKFVESIAMREVQTEGILVHDKTVVHSKAMLFTRNLK